MNHETCPLWSERRERLTEKTRKNRFCSSLLSGSFRPRANQIFDISKFSVSMWLRWFAKPSPAPGARDETKDMDTPPHPKRLRLMPLTPSPPESTRLGCSMHRTEGCMLYVGSASRGDPGHAAVGAVIKAYPNDKLSVVWRAGKSVGEKTRNEAELGALLFGMERALESDYKHVLAMTDSELIAGQFVTGQFNKEPWSAQPAEFGKLLRRVHSTSLRFCRFSLQHIPRSSNGEADSEANQALDKAVPSARIREDSACPVCFELFAPPVFQCPKGHLICEVCLDDLLRRPENEACPECRTPYQGLRIPNVVADDMIKQWRPLQTTYEKPIATHKLQVTLNMRKGPTGNSDIVGALPEGSYVDILEIKIEEKEGYISGRIHSGQWISLEKITGPVAGRVFAHPISLGTYRVNVLTSISTYNGFQINSPKTGELRDGNYVDIVETKLVSEDHCLWGKMANCNWVKLANTIDGSEFASPVPLGTYKIVSYEGLAWDESREIVNAKNFCSLPDGLVDITETKVVVGQGRVRAKICEGYWISLVNLNDGSVWAKPREIAEAEEEEARRQEQARREEQTRREEQARRDAQARRECTCNVCGREFFSPHAMNQHHYEHHYEVTHQRNNDTLPRFVCNNGCDRAFRTGQALEQHNRAKHSWLFEDHYDPYYDD